MPFPGAARALYSAGMWLAQPLLRAKLRRRGRAEPGYLEAIGERFGHYEGNAPAPGTPASPLVWIHAVSLGETRAAAGLVAELRLQLPDMRLLLTHGTATGREEGKKLLLPGDLQAWQPWDTLGAVARFLARFRPSAGVLMETEVWPNLVAACRVAGVPLALANARLSARSQRSAQRLAALSGAAFTGLAAVWAQSADDAARLRTLGAPVLGVFGNLKFDVAPDAALLARGRQWRTEASRPVALFASSREGEEALWLDALAERRLSEQGHRLGGEPPAAVQWLLVPRHPQRFDTVAGLLEERGLRVSRRSTWPANTTPAPADVWLGDSLGEMALYYGLADAALLGGSFAPVGGQNLIEAAACGCPVVMGPSTFNFAEASALAEAAGAAQRVGDMSAGVAAVEALAADAARVAAGRDTALAFAAAHRGAAQCTAKAVAGLLGLRAPAAR
jgi:3-deoxy-D-manno-octulosonic-acid transferase